MSGEKYLFPFTTCEKPKSGLVAQPVSTFVNVLTCIGLIGLLLVTVGTEGPLSTPVVALVLALIAFELWHAFSHMRHIEGRLQAYVIHALTYLIAFMTLWVIYTSMGSVHLGLVAFAIALDIAILFSNQTKLSVLSGVLVFVAVILGNIGAFPPKHLPILFALIVLGAAVFLMEHHFCQVAMNAVEMPYHAIVEIIVMTFILTFAKMMLSGFG